MPAAVTARTKLRIEIEQRFLPLIRQRGFEGPAKLSGNQILHEFFRSTSEGRQCLSIQFEKYRKPRVVLNLAMEPTVGFESFMQSGGTIVQGTVTWKPGGMTGSWFRADRPLWHRLLGRHGTTESAAVTAMISCLNEIDRWWDTQTETVHIRVLSITHPASD